MSWVTVKVPWAPQPLACMRRSGITSRSKCAIFSISQMSCSSAGPRGPAVRMLVLSATGAPVALVNLFSVDMIGSCVVLNGRRRFDCGRRRCLPSPRRSADHAAEVASFEGRVLVGEHVGLHIAECSFRFVLDAVVEGLNDLLLEVIGARVGMHDSLALCIAVLVI